MMMGVPEKYALEVSSPTPIASKRVPEQWARILERGEEVGGHPCFLAPL
jgi:hypothetical protein